ncbi:MAG: hypothetical protein V4508_09825 [Pseudomonadota bacterium]
MKALTLLALLGALCTTAGAQTAVESVRIPGASQRFALPTHLHDVWYEQFEQLSGPSYQLSNGKTLQLSLWGNRMYARIDGMPRRQLVAAAPTSFISLDRQMKLSFDVSGPGPVRGELVTVPGVLAPLAAGPQRLFARR